MKCRERYIHEKVQLKYIFTTKTYYLLWRIYNIVAAFQTIQEEIPDKRHTVSRKTSRRRIFANIVQTKANLFHNLINNTRIAKNTQ